MSKLEEKYSAKGFKRCPFCGSSAEVGVMDPGVPYPGGYFYVDCLDECMQEPPFIEKGFYEHKDEILERLKEKWNTRFEGGE
jgi:hypothetical protein